MCSEKESRIQQPAPGMQWAVLHTRPRCEKKTARFCEDKGFTYYLPLIERIHQYGRKEVHTEVPVFSGYLFVLLPDDKLTYVKGNQYVANLLTTYDQAALLKTLQSLDIALSACQTVEVMPYLEKGTEVEIAYGPMKGVIGIVEKIKGKSTVVINIELIQQSVAIEIEATNLKPL